LLLAKQARIELAAFPVPRRDALPEVTRTFTTPENLCAGNNRLELCQRAASSARLLPLEGSPAFATAQTFAAGISVTSVFPMLCPLSYGSYPLPVGIEPTSVGLVDVTRACATPQTLSSLF